MKELAKTMELGSMLAFDSEFLSDLVFVKTTAKSEVDGLFAAGGKKRKSSGKTQATPDDHEPTGLEVSRLAGAKLTGVPVMTEKVAALINQAKTTQTILEALADEIGTPVASDAADAAVQIMARKQGSSIIKSIKFRGALLDMFAHECEP